MLAVLDIKDFVVDEVKIATNGDFNLSLSPKTDDVAVDYAIMRSKDCGREFLINLWLKVNSKSLGQSGANYYIDLAITGFFEFAPGVEEETINRMIAPSGLTMLYGVSRGYLAQATANCRYGKYLLPSLNFIEIIKARAKASASGRKPKKSPPK